MCRTATHTAVVAQLLVPDTTSHSSQPRNDTETKYIRCGTHPFIIQIRDQKTHQPLPGIVVGDIGPKYGYASMDNGYMLFDQCRVPHSAMMARYSKVDPETGKFSREGHPAVVYGSLTYVRANIIMHARLILARAVTIAVRYTSIRRQFRDRDDPNDSGPEVAVLDYPTVQIRILPLLATTFALHYTGEAMYNLYNNTRREIEQGDFSRLAEMHSTSSGLKSLCTMYAADGIEVCRRAMGGHGFGGGSGLVGINSDYLSKPTVEGDNWMITQQVASYLIKKMAAVVKDPRAPSQDPADILFKYYLERKDCPPTKDILKGDKIDDEAISEAFAWRAAHLSFQAYEARIVQKQKWNMLLIQLHKLSRGEFTVDMQYSQRNY